MVVLETSTIAAIVRATDAAAKGAMVEVAELRIGSGLGGRGLAILTGERTDVEAAAEIATQSLAGRNVTLCHSIISNVHEQFAERDFGESSRFFGQQIGTHIMLLGRVIGTLVACEVYEGLEGVPMLVVQPLTKSCEPKGDAIICADSTRWPVPTNWSTTKAAAKPR